VLVLAVLKLTLRLELGPEYDSNANRAEIVQGVPVNGDAPTDSFLLRTTIRPSLAWRRGANTLRLTGVLGGKVFFNPNVWDQNVIVGELGVEDRVRLNDHFDLGLAADYYDSTQQSLQQQAFSGTCDETYGSSNFCDRHRDFRSGSATGRVGYQDDIGQVVISGGYHGFQWKPDHAFDFNAGQASVLAGVRLYAGAEQEHEIDLTASYHFERRFFASPVDVNNCVGMPMPSCVGSGSDLRSDWFHEGIFELTWVRWVLLSASYSIVYDDSNSFGWSVIRHIVTAKLGARLFWQLYLTVKGQLLIDRYLDPLILVSSVTSGPTFLNIEDENRNAVIVDLERPIGRTGLAVEARYSVATNALASNIASSYLRQVVYLGISYRVGSK
jgi:hypothetical protein